MDVFKWIEQELKPRTCTSEEFIYDDMQSQSGHSLPIIYQPFDAGKKSHWQDRGSLFDYLFSTGGKKLLDFGPGDGWPSLIVAPYVDEVVGVEGSVRRVETCTDNAGRLGISNARFIYVEPGKPLPFEDNSFDGAMAASSVEQTPDPKAALQEIFRVLRPGGRFRISYEALSQYKNGREREAWLWPIKDRVSRLILFDRNVDQEIARQYGLTLAMSQQEVIKVFSKEGHSISFDMITIPSLERARSFIVDARVCLLTHPSGKTMVFWLNGIGFGEIIPTHSGAEFAGALFEQLEEESRPGDMSGVDAMLRPLVRIVVETPAPVGIDPMITAIK
jgi:ubiquinone/menaquinone biosynthesis C-methylase UbiE